jgi:hypothetical protein
MAEFGASGSIAKIGRKHYKNQRRYIHLVVLHYILTTFLYRKQEIYFESTAVGSLGSTLPTSTLYSYRCDVLLKKTKNKKLDTIYNDDFYHFLFTKDRSWLIVVAVNSSRFFPVRQNNSVISKPDEC